MALVNFSSLIGKQIITQDGYILGLVQDLRYVNQMWTIQGLKVKTSSSVSEVLNIGSGKSLVLLGIGDYVINDVILLPDKIDSASASISADNVSFPSVNYLMGKKVFSTDGLFIGTVDSIDIDTDLWCVVSVIIKLDKAACDQLGVKKGLFAKRVSGILTSHIGTVTDSIALNIDIETVKSQIIIV